MIKQYWPATVGQRNKSLSLALVDEQRISKSSRAAPLNLLEAAPSMLNFDAESLAKVGEARQVLDEPRKGGRNE